MIDWRKKRGIFSPRLVCRNLRPLGWLPRASKYENFGSVIHSNNAWRAFTYRGFIRISLPLHQNNMVNAEGLKFRNFVAVCTRESENMLSWGSRRVNNSRVGISQSIERMLDHIPSREVEAFKFFRTTVTSERLLLSSRGWRKRKTWVPRGKSSKLPRTF